MDQYLDAVRNISRIMTTNLVRIAKKIKGIRVTLPEAGYYFMVDLNPLSQEIEKTGIRHSNDLAQALISHPYHIATVTGEAMMAPYGDYFIRFAVTDYDGEKALITYLERPPVGEIEEEAFFRLHGSQMIKGMDKFEAWVKDVISGSFRITLN